MLHVILAFSEHYVPSQDVPSLPSLRVLDGLALGWMVSRHAPNVVSTLNKQLTRELFPRSYYSFNVRLLGSS